MEQGSRYVSTELADHLRELVARTEDVEKSLPQRGAPVRPHTRTVVITCLCLGGLCILSAILKSWLGIPSSLDWGLLLIGVVLCGVSLFKEFTINKEGLSVKVVDVYNVVNMVKKLTNFLPVDP